LLTEKRLADKDEWQKVQTEKAERFNVSFRS